MRSVAISAARSAGVFSGIHTSTASSPSAAGAVSGSRSGNTRMSAPKIRKGGNTASNRRWLAKVHERAIGRRRTEPELEQEHREHRRLRRDTGVRGERDARVLGVRREHVHKARCRETSCRLVSRCVGNAVAALDNHGRRVSVREGRRMHNRRTGLCTGLTGLVNSISQPHCEIGLVVAFAHASERRHGQPWTLSLHMLVPLRLGIGCTSTSTSTTRRSCG